MHDCKPIVSYNCACLLFVGGDARGRGAWAFRQGGNDQRVAVGSEARKSRKSGHGRREAQALATALLPAGTKKMHAFCGTVAVFRFFKMCPFGNTNAVCLIVSPLPFFC